MGPGPIPESAIERFARRDGLTRLEREVLHYCMRRLDGHFLKSIGDKNKGSGN